MHLSKDQVREILMKHGFTIKDGQTDLKQYVYDAVDAVVSADFQAFQCSLATGDVGIFDN
jgi:hypothetical protein